MGVAVWVCRCTNMKREIIQTAIAFCALLSLTIGGMAYFAKADDLRMVELRLDQKITNDQILQLQNRLWQLEDRHDAKKCDEWPQSVKEEHRKLKAEIDDLKLRQQRLMTPGRK